MRSLELPPNVRDRLGVPSWRWVGYDASLYQGRLEDVGDLLEKLFRRDGRIAFETACVALSFFLLCDCDLRPKVVHGC
jgi:hypothetical protein